MDDEFPLYDHEPSLTDPRIPTRVEEFRERILARYPEATFEVKRGGEPPGVYLMATVDTEDIGEVLDTIMDRLLEVQVEEYLPVYVIPLGPLHPPDPAPQTPIAAVSSGAAVRVPSS